MQESMHQQLNFVLSTAPMWDRFVTTLCFFHLYCEGNLIFCICMMLCSLEFLDSCHIYSSLWDNEIWHPFVHKDFQGLFVDSGE